MFKRKIKIMIKRFFLLLMPLLVAAGCDHRAEKAQSTKSVLVAEAQSVDGNQIISFPGRAKAVEEINLSFRISGPIAKILVREGDYVKSGDVLAVMDDRDYKTQLSAVQAEYDRIEADAKRVIAMYQEGATTAQNYDLARYGLEQITQKLNNCKNQLKDTKLVSPVSGYVKERVHSTGETVAAGMPVILLSAGNRLEVEINISSRDYARLSSLKDFYCKFDVLQQERIPLTLVSTSKTANANQLYQLRFAVEGNYNRNILTPGMTTVVYAQAKGGSSAAVKVPSSALLNKNGKTVLFLYDDAQKRVLAREVEVKSMLLDGDAVVEGIESGSQVVRSGVRHLLDGQSAVAVRRGSESNVGGLM